MSTYGSVQKIIITGKNNSTVTTIPDGTGVLFDTANPATGDYPPGVVIPTASGGVVGTFGVTIEDIPPGKIGKVMVLGAYEMTADGSITAGGYVQVSDTSGKMGRVKAKGATVEQLGQALNTVTDGQPCWVYVAKAACA